MQLLDLPDELLDICCSRIDELTEPIDEDAYPTADQINLEALRNLRLTCKRISPLVNKHLFSRLVLRPETNNAVKARAILNDVRLNPLVHTIYLQASVENDRIRRRDAPKPTWDVQNEDDLKRDTSTDNGDHSAENEGELPVVFKRIVGDIGLFSNLRRIELVYDFTVERLTGESWTDAKEDFEYRDVFFRKLLSAINHADHRARKLNSLSIHNLQDCVNLDTAKSTDFSALLSQLDELELLVLSEEQHDEYEIQIPERHDFYSGQLRECWLQPLSDIGRLSRLKLYGSISWGYIPKCDLRGLHFPKLRSLDLGNMTFTHEWQLEWILSHGGSLERLALRSCPIIPDIELIWRADADGYPILPNPYPGTGRGRPPIAARSKYDLRWHDYFRNFRIKLPHLRHFAVTHGGWMQGNEGPCEALRVFKATETWPAELSTARYSIMTGYDARD